MKRLTIESAINRPLARTIVFCAAGALALGLTACAGGSSHQVIDLAKPCVSCHEQKTTYDDVDTGKATKSNGTVKVKTSAEKVSVCKPTFTSSDGSTYVPVRQSTVQVSGGEATVELEEGIWALCLDKGDKSSGQIVVVSASESESAEITLN